MNLFAGKKLMASAAFDATVRGRVQHVGFRYYACVEAERFGVCGWIRNNSSGEVEVHAEGEAENLKKFLSWLNKGPPHGRVDSVNISRCAPSGTYRGFVVDYDG